MRHVRKPVYRLTLADLREFPVWEYASDEDGVEGQDEATVRPRPEAYARWPMEGVLLRTRFKLADGSPMLGMSSGRSEPSAL
jgi:hypothetical protein